jgi:HEAT repeat protein
MTPEVLAGLLHLFSASDEAVRAEAVEAVGCGAERARAPGVLDAVCARLTDPSAEVRRQAVIAFGNLQQPGDDVPSDILAQRLTDHNGQVRNTALELVTALGRRALCHSVIEALGALVEHRGRTHRLDALFALQGLGPPAAISTVLPAVVACLHDPSASVARQACDTLAAMGPAGIDYLEETLVAQLRSPERRERDGCVRCFNRLGKQFCRPTLLDRMLALLDDGPGARAAACAALEWIGPEAAVPAILTRLEELCDDADGDVRYHARTTLFGLRPSPP